MSGKMWSYAAADFEDVQEAATQLSDGWGVTSDGTHLIVGDSSDTLTWVDPAAGMASVRQVAVQGACCARLALARGHAWRGSRGGGELSMRLTAATSQPHAITSWCGAPTFLQTSLQ
jgi:hypothetical protein